MPEHERPWIVIVWNDPINLMSYVTFVFQKLFGYSREKATKLMLQVHNEGKAVVSGGPREKAGTTSPASTPTGSGRRCVGLTQEGEHRQDAPMVVCSRR